MGSPPGLRCSSRVRTVPKPWVSRLQPLLSLGALTPLVNSLPSRILTVGLVCASLYAGALGAGAVAQDEEPTPTPTQTAKPDPTSAPTTAPTTTPEKAPATTKAPTAATPAETAAPTAEPTATATPGRIGVDKTKRQRKDSKPNRTEGDAALECPADGELI